MCNSLYSCPVKTYDSELLFGAVSCLGSPVVDSKILAWFPRESIHSTVFLVMDFEIRPLREIDLVQVLNIENACYPNPWKESQFRQELTQPFAHVDLCWTAGGLAGYLCYWLIAGEMQILNVATAPDFQRRGVARLLLQHALKVCAGQGLQRSYLEVRVGNRAAISLYRSFGFVDDGLRPRYYADGEDALLMVKIAD